MDAASLRADRPRLDRAGAERLGRDLFGFEGRAHELPSDRDRNFVLEDARGARAVLKIARCGEARAVLELEGEVMRRALAAGVPVPRPVPAADGALLRTARLADGRAHHVRLIGWLEGRTLASVRPQSLAVLRELGAALGGLDRALADLDHPAARRALHWDLAQAEAMVARGRALVTDTARADLLARWMARLAPTLDRLDQLPRQVIHNDANDHNVLVLDHPGDQRLGGLLDFGDCLHGLRAAEPAIAIAYAMLEANAPLEAAGAIAAGYQAAFPLSDEELGLLIELAALRLCQSVAHSAQRAAEEQDDAYLTVSEAPAWRTLQLLERVPRALGAARVRTAAGRPASHATVSADAPADLVTFDRGQVETLDLSVASAELAQAGGPGRSSELVAAARGRGRVPLARFGEVSEVDATLEPGQDRDEPCTRRLGVELFLPRETEVRAPWSGRARVAHDVLVLRAAQRPVLRLGGLDVTPTDGADLEAGDTLGRSREVLQVQLVADDLDLAAALPVRARPGDPLWGELALDPGPLLGLPAGCSAPPPAAVEEAQRGAALSLAYRAPLTIVRGAGTSLVDVDGRAYLDAVNNVPHVGHCHPRVVAALRAQAAVLNTNTRYLHPLRQRYLARLAALFADPLERVYLVNSGSEANELALRLVEAATGGTDWIVVEGGYHGNTRRLVERSHYKFAGPGGCGPPETVRVVPLPDTYRGRHRGPDAGQRYAAHVAEACARVASSGRRLAGMLVEPLIGCGGQVVPPEGWLRRAFELVRAAGGLCVADEVQVGFGRVGTHWWAFDEQGAEPDLVTLGKPIGNGHPLGAVVTSRAISEAFGGGMEWFNTFGGNPVSCAVGLAVLDVIEDEGLRDNARAIGARLLAGLDELTTRHTLIGDVRGRGLYLGVELVLERETRAPAGEHAAHVAERMKARGVLVGTDGPAGNVLKIKPPLCFSHDDAERLVEVLDAVLSETVCADSPIGANAITPRAWP